MATMSLLRLSLAGLLAAATTSAQEIVQPSGTEETPVADARARQGDADSRRYLSFTGNGEYTFDADFDDAAGDVSIFRIGAGVEVGLPAGERGRLALGVKEEFSSYDIGGAPFGGSAGDDFEPHIQSLTARYSRPLSADWSMLVLADMTLAGEWDADLDDKITYGAGLLFNYAVSEDLTLGAGARVYTRIEDDVMVLPMFNIQWQIDERWRLAVGRGATVAYAFDDEMHWTLDLGVTYENRRFRLDDSHAGRLRDGVIEDERVPVTLGVTFEPHRGLKARVFAGAVVWQELTAEDSGGSRLAEEEADPAAMLGASLTLNF